MAKKQFAEKREPKDIAHDLFHVYMDRVEYHLTDLKEGSPKDRLQAALDWWNNFPRLFTGFCDSTIPNYNLLEEMCIKGHELAVEIIMTAVEKHKIDSTQVSISGHHCREILKLRESRDPAGEPSVPRWPAYLGSRLYDLPADVRVSILEGHAAVCRLTAKLGMNSEVDITSWIPAAKKPMKSRDLTFQEWNTQGMSAKQIAHKWNSENDDDVTADAVTKAIQRLKSDN